MFDFVSYMRIVAEKLKDIQHGEGHPAFHRVTNLSSLEEVISNARRMDTGFQLVVEDVMEGNFLNNNDTLLDSPTFRYYVIKYVKTNNFDDKEEAKRQCKVVAKKIVSKIKHDAYFYQENSFGLKDLDRGSFQYFSIGPMIDNFWGIEISFSIIEAAGIKYNANDWNE